MTFSTDIRDPLVGTRIDDRYLVRGVLGRGGMGVVYEGVHERLGRQVAIKVLGPGIAGDRNAVERFLREARTASQLTHGNIVDVSDLGALPDGRPYLVMAKLEGIDLCSLLHQRGPQTPRRTVELLRGAAAALDLIHAKGYVHRDVKPENLMHVVREDGSEAVLLLDFGIVGLVSPEHQRLTAQGTVFGTPAYLAPEAIRGAPPHPLSDIYALATVCYELITGHTPFSSDNPLQLMQMKLAREAPPLSSIAGFDFPEAIERAVARGLTHDPAARYATASALINALDSAVQSHASQVLPLNQGGLDDRARERLRTGTAGLEFGSMSPSSAATVRSDAPPEVVLGNMRAKQRRMGWIGLAALAAAIAWLGVRIALPAAPPETAPVVAPVAASPPPPAATVPAPLPAAAEPEPAPDPRRPAVSPRSTPEAKPARTARAPAAKPLEPPNPPQPPAAEPVPPNPQPPAGPSASELVNLAQRELLQGHLQAAADAYARATRLDPNNAAAFRGLGLAEERLGHKAAALRALKRALVLSKNDSATHALLEERVRKLEGN